MNKDRQNLLWKFLLSGRFHILIHSAFTGGGEEDGERTVACRFAVFMLRLDVCVGWLEIVRLYSSRGSNNQSHLDISLHKLANQRQ